MISHALSEAMKMGRVTFPSGYLHGYSVTTLGSELQKEANLHRHNINILSERGYELLSFHNTHWFEHPSQYIRDGQRQFLGIYVVAYILVSNYLTPAIWTCSLRFLHKLPIFK